MNRIRPCLDRLRQENKKALTLFLTAGFPRLDSTVGLVSAFEDAGADMIELGMPFSDPLADGHVIQECSSVALRNGVTLEWILSTVRAIRLNSNMPLVLMGYLNPILRYGAEKFFADAASSGVDGIILPEVPVEEASRFGSAMASYSLSNILLVAPTTPPSRVELIDAASSGFVYCVSGTGVTCRGGKVPDIEYIRSVRLHVKKNPLLVGFGISKPEDAHAYAHEADGVIVGSALLQRIMKGESTPAISAWVRELKAAL